MLSISGYGRTGRRSSYAAYASNISNHVGLSSAWGHTHGYHFDYVAGYHGALGVLAALRQAERDGDRRPPRPGPSRVRGHVMMPILVDHLAIGAEYQRRDNVVPGSVLQCRRGLRRRRSLAGGRGRRRCRLGSASAASSSSGPPPIRRRAELDAARTALGEWAATRTPTRRPTCCSGPAWRRRPCRTRPDLARDPQLRARQFIVEIDHPDLGRIEYPGAVERTVQPSGGVKGPVPRLGEHTRRCWPSGPASGTPRWRRWRSGERSGSRSNDEGSAIAFETISHNTVPSVTAPIRGCRVRVPQRGTWA